MLNIYFAVLRNSEKPSGTNLAVLFDVFYDGKKETLKESRTFLYSGRWNRSYDVPESLENYTSLTSTLSLLQRHREVFDSQKEEIDSVADAYDSESEFSDEIYRYLKDLIDRYSGRQVNFLWHGIRENPLTIPSITTPVINFYNQMYWLRQILVRGGNAYVFRFGRNIYSVNLSEFNDVKEFEDAKVELDFPKQGDVYTDNHLQTHVCLDNGKSGNLFVTYPDKLLVDVKPSIYYHSAKDLPYNLTRLEESTIDTKKIKMSLGEYFDALKTIPVEENIYNINFGDMSKIKTDSTYTLNFNDPYEKQLSWARAKLALNSLTHIEIESIPTYAKINQKLADIRAQKSSDIYHEAFAEIAKIDQAVGDLYAKSIKI